MVTNNLKYSQISAWKQVPGFAVLPLKISCSLIVKELLLHNVLLHHDPSFNPRGENQTRRSTIKGKRREVRGTMG